MPDDIKKRLIEFIDGLIEEGNRLREIVTDRYGSNPGLPDRIDVESEGAGKLWAGCQHLIHILGNGATPWRERLAGNEQSTLLTTELRIGYLKAIRDAIESGLLVRVEDLVMADTFDNLLEQAKYLFAEKYSLAAGVLGRAVLEEHLRKWCERAGIMPEKPRPTLDDLNQALYKSQHIDKLTMKQVDALAAVGNACAHNQQFTVEQVERLLREVRDFLLHHPAT